MQKTLLHTCCGPCATFVTDWLQANNYLPILYFYNPNIHPYQEYHLRLENAKKYVQAKKLSLIEDDHSYVDNILQYMSVAFGKPSPERCKYCYQIRLEATAKLASQKNFESFTTTLLISPYQNQELINAIGEELGEKYHVKYLKEEFKKGYAESRKIAKTMELYQQKYCGCIYSLTEKGT